MGLVTGVATLRLVEVSRSQLSRLRAMTLRATPNGGTHSMDVLVVAGDAQRVARAGLYQRALSAVASFTQGNV
jgi:hypothetical protein